MLIAKILGILLILWFCGNFVIPPMIIYWKTVSPILLKVSLSIVLPYILLFFFPSIIEPMLMDFYNMTYPLSESDGRWMWHAQYWWMVSICIFIAFREYISPLIVLIFAGVTTVFSVLIFLITRTKK